eukprot:GILK01009343.1.p1 GENE.GILK01009343.1~~GILK01009343.1.p1  ORF type:complete len:273 (-),score=39.91 GILK01009343.1:191-982(-)
MSDLDKLFSKLLSVRKPLKDKTNAAIKSVTNFTKRTPNVVEGKVENCVPVGFEASMLEQLRASRAMVEALEKARNAEAQAATEVVEKLHKDLTVLRKQMKALETTRLKERVEMEEKLRKSKRVSIKAIKTIVKLNRKVAMMEQDRHKAEKVADEQLNKALQAVDVLQGTIQTQVVNTRRLSFGPSDLQPIPRRGVDLPSHNDNTTVNPRRLSLSSADLLAYSKSRSQAGRNTQVAPKQDSMSRPATALVDRRLSLSQMDFPRA